MFGEFPPPYRFERDGLSRPLARPEPEVSLSADGGPRASREESLPEGSR